MPIPQVTITPLDGGLGTIIPSNASTHAKLGVCSLGTASVAASAILHSTTGGDGVTYTAQDAGAKGNLISINILAPSGGATVVTVVGKAIQIAPKSAATNADIKTAVDASPAASALVATQTTGGSDLVVSAGPTMLTGGVDGTINTVIPLTTPQQALSKLGYGPLSDAAGYSLNYSSGLVYAVPVNPSVDPVIGSIVHIGTGPSLSASGSPYDSYSVLVTIITGGARGTATFTYSLDDGVTTSAVTTVPSGGDFTIPNSGLDISFGGSNVAGDLYAFTTTAPGFSTDDVDAAFAALLSKPQTWNFAHLVGAQATVDDSADMATEMDSIMHGAASAYRFTWGVVEVPTDSDAAIETAFANFVSDRTMLCVDTATTSCPVSKLTLNRSSAYAVTARAAKVSIATDLGQVNLGPLPGLTAIQRDEGQLESLDELGFTTLRTFVGETGFYITKGHMKVDSTSDYFLVQRRRVMDAACAQAYKSMLFFLNSTLLVNKTDGTLAELSAQAIEAKAGNELSQAILAPQQCTATSLVVDRSNNVEEDDTLNVTIGIIPLAYADQINVTLSFTNPGLQTQS